MRPLTDCVHDVGELWAAADVFLSLVDNIQETFGITPLEAMAAGLPVVASDWDGYRYTMRDSDVPVFSYDKSQVGINVTAQY